MKLVILLVIDVIRGAGVNMIINLDKFWRRLISTGQPIFCYNAIIYRKCTMKKKNENKINRKKGFIITWRLLVGFG